jgi:hypothetical protein
MAEVDYIIRVQLERLGHNKQKDDQVAPDLQTRIYR